MVAYAELRIHLEAGCYANPPEKPGRTAKSTPSMAFRRSKNFPKYANAKSWLRLPDFAFPDDHLIEETGEQSQRTSVPPPTNDQN
jgi:hypothetical protein